MLGQDIERRAEEAIVHEGVVMDRMRKRFDGQKVQIAIDVEIRLVTAVAVLPGTTPMPRRPDAEPRG